MPRRDGTGPVGLGAMTGKELGRCSNNALRQGAGLRVGAGMGYGMNKNRERRRVVFNNGTMENSEDVLLEEKRILEERLKMVNGELEREK